VASFPSGSPLLMALFHKRLSPDSFWKAGEQDYRPEMAASLGA
jgi:hypothetical protein